jgi:hypothetical protein
VTEQSSIEENLMKALELIQRNAGTPADMWDGRFGWILKDGKPGDGAQAFLDWMNEQHISDGSQL